MTGICSYFCCCLYRKRVLRQNRERQKLKIMVPIDKVKSLMKEPDTLQLEEGIEED